MYPKAFTGEARDAIRIQSGPLFEAIVNAYTASNSIDADDEDEDEEERVAHVPELLKNIADPYVVHLVYSLYRIKLPQYVTSRGKRVQILEDDERIEDQIKAFRSFHLLFGGADGWYAHAKKYTALGQDRKELELLAVKWLQGDWQNAEFFRRCELVPGFREQLDAITADEEGNLPGPGAMLHLAGYRQMREQFAKEGGNPEDMDQLVLAGMTGDDTTYNALRKKIERKGQPTGCAPRLAALLVFAGLIWLFSKALLG